MELFWIWILVLIVLPPLPPATKQRRPSRGVFHSYIQKDIPIKHRLVFCLYSGLSGNSSSLPRGTQFDKSVQTNKTR